MSLTTEQKRKRDLKNIKIGNELRRRRESLQIRAYWVADFMGISPSKLSEMENGKRNWTEDRIAAYRRALKEI